MKTKTFTNTDLAQRAHYRLITYFGLGASQLLWLAEGVELVVHVRPGDTRQISPMKTKLSKVLRELMRQDKLSHMQALALEAAVRFALDNPAQFASDYGRLCDKELREFDLN